MWLCRPDRPGGACDGDQTATDLRADGTRDIEPFAPAVEPAIDCFYVYPTVDLGLIPGSHDDFRDTAPMAHAALSQAARFREACKLYVPLYRQATIGAYLASDERRDRYLEIATADVAEAFVHYMGQFNHGRRVVLLGHSQGGDVVVRLLQQFFDDDALMRERLVLAIVLGTNVDVPRGQLVGGTFQHLEPCRQADQLSCYVAYHSYVAGSIDPPHAFLPPAGQVSVCVAPADLADNTGRRFSRTYLPMSDSDASGVDAPEISTPFLLVRDLYEGRCVDGADGFRYLAVSLARRDGDTRKSPIELGAAAWHHALGLHSLDFQFAQGDLVDLVARRAAKVAVLSTRHGSVRVDP